LPEVFGGVHCSLENMQAQDETAEPVALLEGPTLTVFRGYRFIAIIGGAVACGALGTIGAQRVHQDAVHVVIEARVREALAFLRGQVGSYADQVSEPTPAQCVFHVTVEEDGTVLVDSVDKFVKALGQDPCHWRLLVASLTTSAATCEHFFIQALR
jgi:hypothetical protein